VSLPRHCEERSNLYAIQSGSARLTILCRYCFVPRNDVLKNEAPTFIEAGAAGSFLCYLLFDGQKERRALLRSIKKNNRKKVTLSAAIIREK